MDTGAQLNFFFMSATYSTEIDIETLMKGVIWLVYECEEIVSIFALRVVEKQESCSRGARADCVAAITC